jgi:hypothetical protein
MKRLAILVAVVLSFCLGGVLVKAATSGTPEVDKANVTIAIKAHKFTSAQCVGEDAGPYVTYRGRWIGTETDAVPATDYNLSGPITVTGIVWTINTSTRRGVLTGVIKLTDAATAKPTYTGRLTVVTEGLPSIGAAAVPGRGWIIAGFAPADDGALPPGDDKLLANTEWLIAGDFSANAVFGESAGTAGTPNFSVVTNVTPALDGVC